MLCDDVIYAKPILTTTADSDQFMPLYLFLVKHTVFLLTRSINFFECAPSWFRTLKERRTVSFTLNPKQAES